MERHFANWGDGREIDVQRLDRSPDGLAAYRAEPWRFTLSLERQPAPRALGLGAGAVPRRALRGGSAPRPRADRGRLREGLPPAMPASSTPTTSGRCASSAATSTSSAGSARCWDTASRQASARRGAPTEASSRPTGSGFASQRRARRCGSRGSSPLAAPPRGPARRGDPRLARRPAAGLAAAPVLARGPSDVRARRRPAEPPARRARERVAVDADWGWEFVRSARQAARSRPTPHLPQVRRPADARLGDPALARGLRRPRRDLPADPRARGARTQLRRLRLRPVPLRRPAGHRAQGGDSRALRPARRRGLRRASTTSTQPTSRSRRAGGRPTQSATSRAARRRSTSSRTTSPSSIRPPSSRSGPSRPTRWATGASRTRPGSRASSASGTGSRSRSSTWVPTSRPTRSSGPETREPGLIAVYARGETSRRAVELAIAGLATLFERRLDQRVVLFGSNFPPTVPFPCENVGVVPPAELAALYRRASIGLVFSLTNLSLVDQEMMAAGLPVVELDVENVSASLGPLRRACAAGEADAGGRRGRDRAVAGQPGRGRRDGGAGASDSSRATRGGTPPSRSRPRCYDYLGTPAGEFVHRDGLREERNRVTELLYEPADRRATWPSSSVEIESDPNRRRGAGSGRRSASLDDPLEPLAASGNGPDRKRLSLTPRRALRPRRRARAHRASIPRSLLRSPPPRRRPARRRRIDLPRRPRGRRAGGRRRRAGAGHADPRLRLLVGPRRPRACSRVSGGRVARLRSDRRGGGVGEREHARRRVRGEPDRSAARLSRRLLRRRLRDLDLVALRRRTRRCAGSTRCTSDPARAAISC